MVDNFGALADANLAHTWAAIARLSGGPVDRFGSLQLAATGIPAAFFNGAYLAAPPTDDPDGCIRHAIEFMAVAGVPWLLWIREGVDDALMAAGRRAGLRDVGGPPAMGLASIRSVPEPPAGLEHADRFRSRRGRSFPRQFLGLVCGSGRAPLRRRGASTSTHRQPCDDRRSRRDRDHPTLDHPRRRSHRARHRSPREARLCCQLGAVPGLTRTAQTAL